MMRLQNSTLTKLMLKLTNRRRYVEYKKELHEQKQFDFMQTELESFAKTIERYDEEPSLQVVHSGNAGDIIYSLPTVKRMQELSGKKISYFIKIDQPHQLGRQYGHPLGSVMMNQRMAEMLLPLISSQTYIDHAAVHGGECEHVDLDKFRRAAMMLDRGDISRWYSLITGVSPHVHLPWLHVQPDQHFSNSIVISRSERYRNVLLDYSILDKYPDVVFVGIESEYKIMRAILPKMRWVQVQDFQKLAEIIAGSRFFIGNQSFAYSIAEGLKHPRILEVFWQSPNVTPSGENGYDLMFQPHFQPLIDALYDAEMR